MKMRSDTDAYNTFGECAVYIHSIKRKEGENEGLAVEIRISSRRRRHFDDEEARRGIELKHAVNSSVSGARIAKGYWGSWARVGHVFFRCPCFDEEAKATGLIYIYIVGQALLGS